MIRVFSVTPIHVDAAELARRRRRYAELCPEGVGVHLIDAGPAAPPELATADDLRASDRAVADALAAADGYDVAMPDCVLDPAVPDPVRPAARGMLELVLARLAREGHAVAGVTRNPVIAGELRRRAAAYGTGLLDVAVLDLSVEAIADTARWNAALRTAVDALAERGATRVINGCSAVDVEPDPRLVDPAALALRLLAGTDA